MSNIPCGDQYPSCHFIKDAYIDVVNKPAIEIDLHRAMDRLSILFPEENAEKLEEYRLTQELIQNLKVEVAELQLEYERNKNTKATTDLELVEINLKVVEYDQNKKVIDGFEKLINERKICEKKIEAKKNKIEKCNDVTLELVKQIGSYEEKIASLQQQQQEYKK